MRILVAGKTGQLARSLAGAAIPGDDRLTALGRPDMDITRAETVEAALDEHRPDIVINAAAWTAVDLAESEPEAAFAVNRDGAGNLARACARRGVPLIHVSTDYVFDGSRDAPYREDDPVSPLGVYGLSKLEGERAVIEADGPFVILRIAWVHSPFGTNFVRTMLRLAMEKERLRVVDDQTGCPTYAPHAAQAMLNVARRLLSAPPARQGVYHMAGQGETNWADLAREIFARSAAHGGPSALVDGIPAREYVTPAKRPANSRLDCSRLEKDFGITLPHWKEGVKDCVARLLETGEFTMGGKEQ